MEGPGRVLQLFLQANDNVMWPRFVNQVKGCNIGRILETSASHHTTVCLQRDAVDSFAPEMLLHAVDMFQTETRRAQAAGILQHGRAL